jgi:hypothetical protein
MNYNKIHWILWLSIIAFTISIASLIFVCCRIEPFTFDWLGILVGVLSLLTTGLLGFHIINYFAIDCRIDKKVRNEAEKTKEDMRIELDKKLSSHVAGFLIGFVSVFMELRRFDYAMHLELGAISSFVDAGELSSAQYYLKEFVDLNSECVSKLKCLLSTDNKEIKESCIKYAYAEKLKNLEGIDVIKEWSLRMTVVEKQTKMHG